MDHPVIISELGAVLQLQGLLVVAQGGGVPTRVTLDFALDLVQLPLVLGQVFVNVGFDLGGNSIGLRKIAQSFSKTIAQESN